MAGQRARLIGAFPATSAKKNLPIVGIATAPSPVRPHSAPTNATQWNGRRANYADWQANGILPEHARPFQATDCRWPAERGFSTPSHRQPAREWLNRTGQPAQVQPRPRISRSPLEQGPGQTEPGGTVWPVFFRNPHKTGFTSVLVFGRNRCGLGMQYRCNMARLEPCPEEESDPWPVSE